MLPVLLDIWVIKIYTQGIFLVLAFLWGTFMVWKNVALTSYKEEDVFDGLFLSLLGGLFVGRILYVALHFEDFGFDILKFLLINGYPGIYPIGAIVGFILSLYIFTLSRKMSFMQLIDYVVAPLFLAIAIAKLGSFFSGSEIGTQTKFFLSLKYPNMDGARHLTALYESILFFGASFLSHRIVRQIRREKLSEGFNLWFFIWLYSFITVIFDPLKSLRIMVWGITFDMIVSSLMLLTASIYFIYYFRKLIMKRFSGLFSFGKVKKEKS
jgi:prolipoprotein diacylglyceryltransferase